MGERAIRPLSASVPTGGRAPAKRRRVLIEDARRDGSYLRVTWHAEGQVFVVSAWRDSGMTAATAASKGGGGAVGGVCTGAIRVPAAASAELISLLADGLADAVQSPKTPVTRASAPSVWTTMESTLRSWLATGRKAIVRRRA